MHLEYQLSLQDYLEARRAHRGSFLLYLALGSSACSVGVDVWLLNHDNLPGAIVCFLGGLWIMCYSPLCARYEFRQNPKLREPSILDITETGIHALGAHSSSQLEWSFFQQQAESKSLYLLYFQRNDFLIIPKRLFRAEALGQLRSWLEIHSITQRKQINQAVVWFMVAIAIINIAGTFSMILDSE